MANNNINKQDMPEFFKRHIETSRTFSSNFFAKKPVVKSNKDTVHYENGNQNQTNSPNNDNKENDSKMSTALSSAKKKIITIGTYEMGPIIG